MNADVFRAALEATARVACCAALIGSVGCQPKKTQSADSTPTSNQETVEAKVEDKAEEKPPVVEEVRDLRLEVMKKADASFLACQDKITEHLKNEKQADQNQKWPEDVVRCCDSQAKAVDADSELGLLFERDACCSVLNWQGSRACTPWGPPTPPKMV